MFRKLKERIEELEKQLEELKEDVGFAPYGEDVKDKIDRNRQLIELIMQHYELNYTSAEYDYKLIKQPKIK